MAQPLFARVVFGYLSRSRLIALAAFAILAVATAPLTLIAGSRQRPR